MPISLEFVALGRFWGEIEVFRGVFRKGKMMEKKTDKIRVTAIHVGFLEGNLFNETDGVDVEQSVNKYYSNLEVALNEQYPNTEIDITSQPGEGCPSYDCQTQVYFDDDEAAIETGVYDQAIRDINAIKSQVWEDFDSWVVYQE